MAAVDDILFNAAHDRLMREIDHCSMARQIYINYLAHGIPLAEALALAFEATELFAQERARRVEPLIAERDKWRPVDKS